MAGEQRIEGQPLRAPRPGVSSALLVVAPSIDDSTMRWVDGVQWSPEGCGPAGAELIPCAGNSELLTADDNEPVQRAHSVYLWAARECSTLGLLDESIDYLGRVRRALERDESFLLATQLWGGELLDEPTRTLTGTTGEADTLPTVVTAGELLAAHAFAVLDGELTECARNGQGMIHMSPLVLARLVAAQAVWMSGTTWLSPNGHIIVADAGYDGSPPAGTAPEADTQWMYATDMIWTRRGPLETVPKQLATPEDLAQIVDRSTNDFTVWAGRFALWQWDACCHLAAQLDTTPTAG